MNDKYIHIFSLVVIASALAFIVFLYSTEPRSLAEVTTKSQVALGTYEIDQAALSRGIASFRNDEFPAARAAFDTADPEKRDLNTQFYKAYSYYRQGWGRITNDNDLFQSGLVTINRVMELDPNYRTMDGTLGIKTAAELKSEFEEGLKVTPADFNPMRIIRERK